jgi:polysaccharide biosynthesis/export protein
MKAPLIGVVLLAGLAGGQVRQAATAESHGANLPIQPIGPNDLLAVSVYDGPEFTRTVRVGADGYFRLPMLKERIRAQGLMPPDLEGALSNALKEAGLIVDPFVTVTVAEYNSRPIAVMGAVKRPLTFQAVGPVTLLDALARAEGLAAEAGSEILVTRLQLDEDGVSASLTRRIPIKALLDGADPEFNMPLTGGEEIRVPEVGKIYVLGNVKKPGAYLAPGNPETSVLKALALAEGLAPYPAKQAYIYRREASGARNDIPVDLAKIVNRKSPDLPLLANDILYIPDAKGTRAGMALLEKLLLFGGGAMTALIYTGVR